jgi:hypothetical protein
VTPEELRAHATAARTIHCPGHEDRSPSLSTGLGDDCQVLLHCHAGCRTEDVMAAWGLSMADLFEPEPERNARPEVVKRHVYQNADRTPNRRINRTSAKTFWQEQPDDRGGWVSGVKGVPSVPYHLPEVLEAIGRGETVYVPEGEKDVEAIERAGGVATCNPGGAGKWRPEHARWLQGAAMVVIVPDHDPPGYAHALAVADTLNGVPHQFRLGLVDKPGADVSDHLDAGHALEDLRTVERAKLDQMAGLEPGTGEPETPAAGRTDHPPALRVVLRPASSYGRHAVRWLHGYEGFFPLGMLSLLVGYQGDGKTLLVCLMAANEAQHGRHVVVATTEDEVESIVRPRLEAAGADLDLVSLVTLRQPSGDEDDLYLPDHGGLLIEAIEAASPSLLVIDPMEAFLGVSIDSWKAPSVRRALRPLTTCAQRAGCAAIVVGYVNRSVSTKFLDRVAESMAFSRASRSAVLLWPDPDDPEGPKGSQRILALGKTNLAPRGTQARTYRIEPVALPHVAANPAEGLHEDLEQVTTARIVFTGESDTTADELLAQSKTQAGGGSRMDVAEALLHALLDDGHELPATYCTAVAEAAGIHERTLRRAREAVGAETRKASGDGPWFWRLPREEER